MYSNIFSPIEIGGITLTNRITMEKTPLPVDSGDIKKI